MGNVYEWCWDWVGQYHAGFQTDPAGPETGIYRVLRGGCYLTKARSMRSGNRDFGRQWARSKGNGFRVARSVQK
jgi:formylglycine-generating enzyme required for sulfatase activity